MVTDEKHLRVRDSRDRLIDLLGFGETSPVRDLPVPVEQLVIPLNLSAKIPIEETQPDTVYKLWHLTEDRPIDRVPGTPAQEPGNDATIHLESPPVGLDETYRIRAVKTTTGRWAYLHHLAELKTGLDLSLRAWIRSGELLDPTVDAALDDDPRIVDHGSAVEVVIENSQEGVDYQLVVIRDGAEVAISRQDVRGTLGAIVLVTTPAHDDIEIRIRATRTFDPSENLDAQTDLLDAVLPLRVRTRGDLTVSIAPGFIIDHQGDATVEIENSQPGVEYQLFARLLPDRDFVYKPGDGIMAMSTEGDRIVHIRQPAQSPDGFDRSGFRAVGEVMRGDGETLRMSLSALREDSVVVIEARKQHIDRHGAERPSTAILDRTPVILVRPDPAPALHLALVVELNGDADGARTRGAVQVSGGQAGVYYHLRQAPDGDDLGLPAYFHKPDHDDPGENKGIGQLAIGVDGAVRRAHWTGLTMPSMPGVGAAQLDDTLIVGEVRTVQTATREARARQAPPAPIVLITPLELGTTVHVRAVKAMTGLSAAVSESATIDALPAITVDDVRTDDARTVRITMANSRAGDSYQVMRDGVAIAPAQSGDGGELSFSIPPPDDEAVFDVAVTRASEAGIPVMRIARITVAGGESPS